MKKITANLLLLSMLLVSCATGEVFEKPVVTLELGKQIDGYVFLHDLFEAQEWMVLDTCRNSIISNVDKIECMDKDIYILDKVREKCVYRFNHDGKYMGRIGSYGKGKGEYVGIYDFTIDPTNGHILILGNDSKVYVYDKTGRFVHSKIVSKSKLWNIQATDDGIFMSTNHSTFTLGEDAFLLYRFDHSLNYVDKWNQVLPQYSSVLPMSSFVFQNNSNTLSYIDQKQNRIFLFDKKKNHFNGNIELSFPNPRPLSHYLDATLFMEQENQQKYDWLCEVLNSKEKILTTYFRNGKYCVSVADAKNGKILKEGVLAGVMPRIFPLSGNQYIAAFTPDIFIQNHLDEEFSIQPGQPITADSNLLIVKLKLK